MATIIKDHFSLANDHLMRGAPAQRKFVKGQLFEKLDDGYGHSILKPIASNTVVVGGAVLALQKICNDTREDTWVPSPIDTAYGITNGDAVSKNPSDQVLAVFGCGIGGAGLDFGNVLATSIKQKDVAGSLIPMRYVQTSAMEESGKPSGEDADKYFFKSTYIPGQSGLTNNAQYTAWYLKEFTGQPTITSMWKNAIDADGDGTIINSDISAEDNHTEGIETFVEFTMDLNTEDVREYFELTGNPGLARYNTFGFYTGVKQNGEYHNVRLFSTVHFNNRDVSVKTKSTFIYRIYSLI